MFSCAPTCHGSDHSVDEGFNFFFGDTIVTKCDNKLCEHGTNYVLRTVAAQTPCAYIVIKSKLIASVPADGGSVLLLTFAYAVGASTSYMSLVTVTDPDQQSSGKSGKFRFDDWYFAAFPEEFESIKFDMPTGPESLLFRETVMIHPSGLLLCGQNKFVRHWLDVFLRDKLPPRVVVNLTHDQEFLLGPFQFSELEPGATVSRRFALQQKSKLRMIDDFSIGGVNDSCEAGNKIDRHMVDTFCSMVPSYFEGSSQAGFPSELQAKTYDLKSAYRQVPICPSHYKCGYFCLHNIKRGCNDFYRLRTMPFGATHSVYCFLRLAKLLHAIASRALYLLCTNFYDDYILASKSSLRESASNSLELMFELTGWLYDKDGKKSTDFGKICKALGVEFDFNRAESRVLSICNTSDRKEELLKQIAGAIEAGSLDKQQALVLRGRLGFADSFLHGRLGRLVLSKLVEHAYGRTSRLDDDLIAALDAMSHRLRTSRPREVSVADNLQWFVYTDASFEQKARQGGLGGVLVDQTGLVKQWFGVPLDTSVCLKLGADKKEKIICELEMLATVLAAALWICEETNDLHTHFGDNDAVRFSFVRGSASGEIGQKLMKFHSARGQERLSYLVRSCADRSQCQ